MAGLIESLRGLRAEGLPLTVFALEERAGDSRATALGRDENMAERVRAEFTARPETLLMTFTGNIHSMLKLPPSVGRLPTPMGMLLADLHPASIDLRGSGGTMWNCSPDCGVHDQGKNQAAPMQPLTYIADGDDGIYSGAILVGATTASLPATGAALP